MDGPEMHYVLIHLLLCHLTQAMHDIKLILALWSCTCLTRFHKKHHPLLVMVETV